MPSIPYVHATRTNSAAASVTPTLLSSGAGKIRSSGLSLTTGTVKGPRVAPTEHPNVIAKEIQRSGTRLGEAAFTLVDRQDMLDSNEAVIAYKSAMQKLLYGGEDAQGKLQKGYLALEGRDAVKQYHPTDATALQIRDSAVGALSDNAAQKFLKQTQPLHESYSTQAASHAAASQKVWEARQVDALNTQFYKDMTTNVANPAVAQALLNTHTTNVADILGLDMSSITSSEMLKNLVGDMQQTWLIGLAEHMKSEFGSNPDLGVSKLTALEVLMTGNLTPAAQESIWDSKGTLVVKARTLKTQQRVEEDRIETAVRKDNAVKYNLMVNTDPEKLAGSIGAIREQYESGLLGDSTYLRLEKLFRDSTAGGEVAYIELDPLTEYDMQMSLVFPKPGEDFDHALATYLEGLDADGNQVYDEATTRRMYVFARNLQKSELLAGLKRYLPKVKAAVNPYGMKYLKPEEAAEANSFSDALRENAGQDRATVFDKWKATYDAKKKAEAEAAIQYEPDQGPSLWERLSTGVWPSADAWPYRHSKFKSGKQLIEEERAQEERPQPQAQAERPQRELPKDWRTPLKAYYGPRPAEDEYPKPYGMPNKITFDI